MVDIEAEKVVITKMIDRAFQAEVDHDIEALLDFYAEDVYGIGPNIPAFQGKDKLRAIYEVMIPTIVTIKGESVHMEVSSSGDMAWDWGTNKAEYTGPDGNFKDQGKYFATYKKVDGKWKCGTIAWSSDIPA